MHTCFCKYTQLDIIHLCMLSVSLFHCNMFSITVLTWNVPRLGCHAKKTQLAKSNQIKSSKYHHLFSTHYNTKQKGVLISKDVSFVHNTTVTAPQGHFIIINAITIGNLYGPNTDDSSVFSDLLLLHRKPLQLFHHNSWRLQ